MQCSEKDASLFGAHFYLTNAERNCIRVFSKRKKRGFEMTKQEAIETLKAMMNAGLNARQNILMKRKKSVASREYELNVNKRGLDALEFALRYMGDPAPVEAHENIGSL